MKNRVIISILISYYSHLLLMATTMLTAPPANAFYIVHKNTYHHHSSSSSTLLYESAQDALQRTKAQLQKLQQQKTDNNNVDLPPDPLADKRNALVQQLLQQPANALKRQLEDLGLNAKGRKPDLAVRLAEFEMQMTYGLNVKEEQDDDDGVLLAAKEQPQDVSRSLFFCGHRLSPTASAALARAGFVTPSPIQKAAIPRLMTSDESLILHAQTGSGKTLAYLLPITEALWNSDDDESLAVILTPTRELAAQVAGVASVLAPPGSVRLVSQPTNLMRPRPKERGEEAYGMDDGSSGSNKPRIFIGSAKQIMHSLYGDGKMPAPPTTKPEALFFLKNVQWLVLDEVDRLLNVKRDRKSDAGKKIHEKPAAIVTAAVMRQSLGRAQVVAASATVGRSLRRELSRVMGLTPQECPDLVRGEEEEQAEEERSATATTEEGVHVGRAVTIPETVENFVFCVEGNSSGKLMTGAYRVIRSLHSKPRRMLLVLTRGFGINTKNAIGALRHFGCQPEPQSLLDALEADGTDRMIEKHREVSGASGVGESSSYFDSNDDGAKSYLLVTGEDTVRGLHLDGLDVVIVVGKAKGPDEYTHIAGRTGRAGKKGKVINVVSDEHSMALASWEKMLSSEFTKVDLDAIAKLD